jgi:hypothetical protein
MTKTCETDRSAVHGALTSSTLDLNGQPAAGPGQPAGWTSLESLGQAAAESASAIQEIATRSAIGFLRGEDNPFDIFVATQSADEDFFRFHAPEVHEEAQVKIRRAIEKYSEPNYRVRHQLHPTRTLLVRGPASRAVSFRFAGLAFSCRPFE